MTAFGSSPSSEDDGFEADAVVDELPERIIVVRESADLHDGGVGPIDLDEVDLRSFGADEADSDRPTSDLEAADEAEPDADADAESFGHLAPSEVEPSDDADSLDRSTDTEGDPSAESDADVESLGYEAPATVDPHDDDESFGHLAPSDTEASDDADSLDRSTDAEVDRDDESFGHLGPSGTDADPGLTWGPDDESEEDLGPYRGQAGDRRADLDAMVAQVAASQEPDVVPDRNPGPRGGNGLDWPGRDETSPGTLRPLAPEPVVAARTNTSRSVARRTVSRMRALLGLVLVVLVAGVGLAAAIGVAVLLVVLALNRAFGSG